MKKFKFFYVTLLASAVPLFVSVTLLTGGLQPSKAYAAGWVPSCSTDHSSADTTFGTSNYYGYFSGQQDCYGSGAGPGFVMPGGLYVGNITDFETSIKNALDQGPNSQAGTGAAFIILTMLGKPAGTQKSVATDEYNNWKTLVESYDAKGLITWSQSYSYSRNTFFFNNGGNYDDADYDHSDKQPAILFHNPTNQSDVLYAIKRSCGNPVGSLTSLPSVATGDINGIDVDSTSNGSMSTGFNPTVTATATSTGSSTNAVYKNVSGVDTFGIDKLSVSDPFTTYTVSVPSSYAYNGKTYVPVRSTFCDSTDHPGCDSDLTSASGKTNIIYTDGAKTQDIHLKPNHVINMRWFWQVSGGACGTPGNPACPSPGGGITCPVQASQGVDFTKVSFSPGTSNNDGETTYYWASDGKTHPDDPSPQAGDVKQVRHIDTSSGVNGYVIADDPPGGYSVTINLDGKTVGLPHTKTTIDFTKAVRAYPYDTNTASVTYADIYYVTSSPYVVDASGKGTWGTGTNGSDQTSGSFSGGSATLGECFNRNFDVQNYNNTTPPASPSDLTGTQINDVENPTKATHTSQVTIHFTAPQPSGANDDYSLRTKMSVKGLTYAATYEIHRPDNPASLSTTYSNISLGNVSSSTPVISCSNTSTDCWTKYSYANPPAYTGLAVGSANTQLHPGDQVCVQFTITPKTGTMDEGLDSSGNFVGGNVKSGSGTASSSNVPGAAVDNRTVSVNCSSPVINEPYFKVFGGDISAGDAFEVVKNGISIGCQQSSAAGNANVYGWNTANNTAYSPNMYLRNLPSPNNTSNTYAGAGAQFSIMAINNINGVASDQNNVNAFDAPGGQRGASGLAFANTGVSAGGNPFATGFGAAPSCVPDYYSDEPTGASLTHVAGPITINSSYDGAYELGGTTTINGGNLDAGKHVVIYATGTVNINGNICFPSSGCDDNSTSYNSVSDIPSFVLVVKGNINISPSVTQLDGIYIAQPDDPANPTSSGTLTDCAGVSNSNLWSGCANPLTVNGSFIANRIYLLRTGTSEAGSYRENPSIRAALPGESESLTATVIKSANGTLTCSSGFPDSSGMCPNDYSGGSSNTITGTDQLAPGDDCYDNPSDSICNTCITSGNTTTCNSLSGTSLTVTITTTTSPTCAGGEQVSGGSCVAKTTYTCQSGWTQVSTDRSKCTTQVTPTHASEIFNYNPAFWLTLSLHNASSQNALKYDSIASLPPVL